MSLESTFEAYFKPEIRKNGQDLFRKDVVNLSISSDTQIQAFVKAGTPAKVRFMAKSITSPEFSATCSCSSAMRGQACKHMWATLLMVEKKHPDFLDCKKEIELAGKISAGEKKEPSAAQTKQKEYQKLQYDKQKARAKEIRQSLKKKNGKSRSEPAKPNYPKDVTEALQYFSDNGFPMENEISEEVLRLAKKKLSRVFHPDVGGSHAEVTALNHNFDLLIHFIEG